MNQPVPLVWDSKRRTSRRFAPGFSDVVFLAGQLAADAWRFGRWSARLALIVAGLCFFVGAVVVGIGAVAASFAVGGSR